MRRAIIVLLVTWATAAVLIFFLVDHNMYIQRRNGDLILKDRVTALQKIIASSVFAAIYSAVNSACVLWLLKYPRHLEKNTTQEAGATVCRQESGGNRTPIVQ